MKKIAVLNNLLREILEGKKSSLYRSLYQKDGRDRQTPLSSLPVIRWQDIQDIPYLNRLYVQERLFTKIVYRNGKPALIGRTPEDIAAEPYGMECGRPLVLFKNVHENVEKGLWFYKNNILPLMAEQSPELTAMMARKYEIDAIVGDPKEITAFLPLLEKEYPLEKLHAVRMLDLFENGVPPLTLPSHVKVTAALCLPEGGVIGEKCPDSQSSSTFHLNTDDVFELIEGRLVWTKIRLLPTPLIRYDTGIPALIRDCACAEKKRSIIFT